MTKREAIRQTHQEDTLRALGFTRDEAEALRHISNTLQRWYEAECGDSNDYASVGLERDDDSGKPFRVVRPHDSNKAIRTPIADRERGALRRLAAILKARNARPNTGALDTYIQTDPRGAALYLIRPGDVPDGADVHSYYTNGICVY